MRSALAYDVTLALARRVEHADASDGHLVEASPSEVQLDFARALRNVGRLLVGRRAQSLQGRLAAQQVELEARGEDAEPLGIVIVKLLPDAANDFHEPAHDSFASTFYQWVALWNSVPQ
eukprot:4650114-Pyramimonas_sp.AAC.1